MLCCLYSYVMGKKQKKPKRPQKTRRTGSGNTPLLALRVEPKQKARWKAAADRSSMDLSEWIRHQCDEGCK